MLKGILAILNVSLYYFFFTNKKSSTQKNRAKLRHFLLLTFIVTLFHISIFIILKEKNLFEIHNEIRVKPELLTIDIKNENLLQYLRLEDMPKEPKQIEIYILNHSILHDLYDKYGDDLWTAISQFSDLRSIKAWIMEKNTYESVFLYFTLILLTQYLSNTLNQRDLKKWIGPIIASAFLVELDALIDLNISKGFFDKCFPYHSIFEKIAFFKMMLIPYINTITWGFILFDSSKTKKLESNFDVIQSNHKRLATMIITKNKLKTDLVQNEIQRVMTEMDFYFSKVSNYIASEKGYKEHKDSKPRFSKYFLFAFLIVYVLYQVPSIEKYILSQILTTRSILNT